MAPLARGVAGRSSLVRPRVRLYAARHTETGTSAHPDRTRPALPGALRRPAIQDRCGEGPGAPAHGLAVRGKQLIAGVKTTKVGDHRRGQVTRRTGAWHTARPVPIHGSTSHRVKERLAAAVGEPAIAGAEPLNGSEQLSRGHPLAVEMELRPGQEHLSGDKEAQPRESWIPEPPVHQQPPAASGDTQRPSNRFQHRKPLTTRTTATRQRDRHRLLVVDGVHRPDPSRNQTVRRTQPNPRIRGGRKVGNQTGNSGAAPVKDRRRLDTAGTSGGGSGASPPPGSKHPAGHTAFSAPPALPRQPLRPDPAQRSNRNPRAAQAARHPRADITRPVNPTGNPAAPSKTTARI